LENRKRKRIRHLVDLYYDIQEVRKAADNRLREISKNIEEAREDDQIRIEDHAELEHALDKYIEDHLNPRHLETLEEEIQHRLDKELETVEIYTEFLENVKGISMTLGAGLVAYLDPEKAPYPSSFWKFCGMHPEGAKGRSRGEKIEYNPFMKTHVWKVGDSFVKQRTPKYRPMYDKAKVEENEKLNEPLDFPHNGSLLSTQSPEMKREEMVELAEGKGLDVSDLKKVEIAKAIRTANAEKCPDYEECMKDLKEKADRAGRSVKIPSCRDHIDKRARRKMVKEFLKDLWIEWRRLEGLEVRKPYHEAVQDSKRGSGA